MRRLLAFTLAVAAIHTSGYADDPVDPKTWSDERIAARLLGVGFPGSEATPEITRWVERGVGAVVLYRTNVEDAGRVPALTSSISGLSPSAGLVPIVAIDQEGGSVIRYGPAMLPSAMAIAATASLDTARDAGRFVGCALRAAGITANLAPSLDLSTPEDGSDLGTRAFSSSPKVVADVAAAYVAGLNESGVLAIVKHFPGQGHANGDPHEGIVRVARDRERLSSEDVLPFRRAIEAGIDGVMTAHVAYPKWPGSGEEPATFSRPLITGLLRNELGFEGLVVTDALEMAGTGEDDPGQGAVRAIRAGADLILTHSTRHADLAFNGIVMALRDGSLSRERALQSVRRILEASARRCAKATCAPEAEFPERLARAALTEIGTVKRAPGETDVFVGAPGPLADSFPAARRISIPILPSEPQVESLAAAIAKTAGPIVAAVQNRGQARIVERVQSLQPKRPVTLVALGSPYDALRIRADRYVFAYSFLPVAQRSALEVLEGKRCAPGRLPVDLEPLAKIGAGDPRCVDAQPSERHK